MENHVFQLLAIIATVLSILLLPLLAWLWGNMNKRVDILEAESKVSVKTSDHGEDIKHIEHIVERLDDRMETGFSKLNDRMDSLFTLLTKQKDRVHEPD